MNKTRRNKRRKQRRLSHRAAVILSPTNFTSAELDKILALKRILTGDPRRLPS